MEKIMKKIYTILIFALLSVMSVSTMATTWKVTFYQPEGTTYGLWAQTSSPTEYPAMYTGVHFNKVSGAMAYAVIDPIIIANDHGQVTIKYDSCTATGKIDETGKGASGNLFCSGSRAFGWEATIYQN